MHLAPNSYYTLYVIVGEKARHTRVYFTRTFFTKLIEKLFFKRTDTGHVYPIIIKRFTFENTVHDIDNKVI